MWNLKRIGLLAAAILALASYYVISERRVDTRREERVEAKRLLPLAEGTEVKGLVIEKEGSGPIELVKDASAWRIEKPVRYPAEFLIADGLRTALTATTWERRFDKAEADLDEMGLTRPEIKVTVTLQGGGQDGTRRLLLGREAPAAKSVYAMWEGSGEVYLLYESFARAFDKTLYSLREKKIFEAAADEIHAVEVSLEGKKFILIRHDGQWRSAAVDAEVLDQPRVESFVSSLAGLYVKEFLDGLNPSNPDLGLAERKYFIALTLKDGTEKTLWIGRENKEKKGVYAQKDGETQVLLLPADPIRKAPAFGNVFREKRASASLHSPDLAKVTLKKLGTEVALVNAGGAWRFEATEATSPEKLHETVEALLRFVEGVEFQQPVPDSERPTIPYAITVKLHSADGKTEEYSFYKKGGEILAKSSGEDRFYQVDLGIWTEMDRFFSEVVEFRKL
ncbi:MAG: DUF4340 domain-containing protein [Candidatus Omnitrophica bacterium]|nr:DUF4340 domain-containing protein [Candidatus Omnitrophota bacterium]